MPRAKQKNLTLEQVADIRNYLTAHKWLGAKRAIARKYGVSSRTISELWNGKTYRPQVFDLHKAFDERMKQMEN